MSWQTVQIQAPASFLRERIADGDSSARTKAIYEGLLDVMDLARRATRVQHENSAAARRRGSGHHGRVRPPHRRPAP